MLIIASDLHLADHPARGSFDVAAFLDLVGSLAVRKPGDGDDAVRLVLLGDIFELLKTDAWRAAAVRPWSEPGPELSSVSCNILQAIHDTNRDFFDGLRRLQRDHGLSITYLPGNHDALIGDEALTGVRKLLRSWLPGLAGHDDQPFPWMYLDEEHGVFAEHGHQLDRFNQRCDGSCFVPGDAMVVELLVQLPIRVASEIGASDPRSAQFAPAYAFLHEMDNVEPQTLEAFLCWLEYQMHDVASRESIEAALARASRTRTEELLREATQADWIYLEEEEPGSSDAWVAFVDADRSQLKARVRVIPAAARSADLEVLEFKPPNEGKHESEYVLGSVVAIDPQQVTLETRNNERRTVTLPENVAPPGQHSRVMALLPKGSTKPLSFELLDGWRDMLVANGAAQSEQHLP